MSERLRAIVQALSPPARPETPEELAARRAALEALRQDAKAIAALRGDPAWIRIEALIREQLEGFRDDLENPNRTIEELRAIQWQCYSLRWLIELPEALQRKLETEERVNDQTAPTARAR